MPTFHRSIDALPSALTRRTPRGAIAEARLNVLCAPATIPEAPSGARGARRPDSALDTLASPA